MTLRNETLEARIDYASRRLYVSASTATALAPFEGTAGESAAGQVLEGALSAANAAALRQTFPNLRPAPIGRNRVAVGTGDRIGLATCGHARAFQKFGDGVVPVFAQQSIREMDRLGRDVQSVLDDATFGCVAAGWTGPVGADCDHIKSTEGIDRGLSAGFTMFTLDPGDYVADIRPGITQAQIDGLPWQDLEDNFDAFRARYVGRSLDLNGQEIVIGEDDIYGAAVKYGRCIVEARRLYVHLMEQASYEVEVEIAVDETAFVTSFVEHFYLATELRRLGVDWVSFAPRYADGFEKGVEYLGDLTILRDNLLGHKAVADAAGGYKMSLHSGSDKFSIYSTAVDATDQLIHLKTSGTSYLCALEVVARHDGQLLEEIWRVSRESFVAARNSYQVSADVSKTPLTLTGVDLPELVAAFDSRQILHVGYGDALSSLDMHGGTLGMRLDAVLRENHADYSSVLEGHLGRHIKPFRPGL